MVQEESDMMLTDPICHREVSVSCLSGLSERQAAVRIVVGSAAATWIFEADGTECLPWGRRKLAHA